MGLPLANAQVIIDTLHPIYEGHACRWERGQKETALIEYGRTNIGNTDSSGAPAPTIACSSRARLPCAGG